MKLGSKIIKYPKNCTGFLLLTISLLFGLSQPVIAYNFTDTTQTLLAQTLSSGELTDSITTVGKILLSGNFKTKDRIILREMFLQPGMAVPTAEFKEKVERDRQRIFNTQLFTIVQARVIARDNNKADIFIQLQERWYFVPNLIFKLADRNFNDWWTNQNRDMSRVNYGLRLKHGNFLGLSQKVAVQLQLGYSRSIRLNYYNPYIDKDQKTGVSLRYGYNEQHNIPINTVKNRRVFLDSSKVLLRSQNVGLSIIRRPSLNYFHQFSIGYFSRSFANSVIQENPFYTSQQNSQQQIMALSYDFSHDKRDNASYALKGYQYSIGAYYNEQLTKSAPSYGGVSTTLNFYKPLSSRFFTSHTLNLRATSLANAPYSLQGGLGYSGFTVRGLELYVLEGQHSVLSRNEIKFQALNKVINLGKLMPFEQFRKVPLALYPKLYLDGAYVYQQNPQFGNDLLLNKGVWGTGFGLDIVSYYDFVLKLEYSFNNLGERGFFFHLNTGF